MFNRLPGLNKSETAKEHGDEQVSEFISFI